MKNLRCLWCWCWNYSFYTPAAILDFTRSSDIPKSYPSTFDLLKLVRGNKRWLHCLLGELQCLLPSHTLQLISPVISSRCYAMRINRASHILCLHLFMGNYENGPPWAEKMTWLLIECIILYIMANKDITWLSLTYIWTTIDFTRLQREIAPRGWIWRILWLVPNTVWAPLLLPYHLWLGTYLLITEKCLNIEHSRLSFNLSMELCHKCIL